MTALELRAEIQQLLGQEENISVLEAIRMLLRRGEPTEDDLTDEEVAELDRQRADRLSGKVEFVDEEKSIQMIRAKQKG
ncbi:MAG TPA: hypothetical protein PKD45_02185 [Flavobacteriales bacterium]|nr:hypothetical protein [Flavobacteriales bacterium]